MRIKFTYSLVAALAALTQTALAADVPQDLRQAADEYDAAQIHGDRAALERLLADDYTLVNSRAEVETKKELIRDYTDPKSKLEPFVVKQPIEKVWSDGAVLAGTVDLKGTEDGKAFEVTLHFADIWAKRKGRWQLIFTQVTRAPAGK